MVADFLFTTTSNEERNQFQVLQNSLETMQHFSIGGLNCATEKMREDLEENETEYSIVITGNEEQVQMCENYVLRFFRDVFGQLQD